MDKKYYWLRLKDDFFSLTTTKLLRKMPEGDKLTIIYLKLQLLSLKSNGTLTHHNLLPNLADELAVAIDEESQYVSLTLGTLEKLHLIEPISNDEYLLTAMNDLVGVETKSAIQKRKYREKIRQFKDINQTLLGHKQDINRTLSDREEKEKEIKIDKKKIIDKIKPVSQADEIINYFNNRINKNKYQNGSDRKNIISYIQGMLQNGDTIEDIKNLIDYKLANPNTQKKELDSWINTKYVGKNMADAKTWLSNKKPKIEVYQSNQPKTKAQITRDQLFNLDKNYEGEF